MTKSKTPSLTEVKIIKKHLSYDPDTGDITWLLGRGNRSITGTKAGCIRNSTGYLQVGLNGKVYLGHRLAWLLHYGRWPLGQIDHENGIRSDNMVGNLREVSSKDNNRNQKKARNNTSGITGVSQNPDSKRWAAIISVNSKPEYLGRFIERWDAICSRKSAEVRYGYHPNHGRL